MEYGRLVQSKYALLETILKKRRRAGKRDQTIPPWIKSGMEEVRASLSGFSRQNVAQGPMSDNELHALSDLFDQDRDQNGPHVKLLDALWALRRREEAEE